jgi:glycerol kinase
MVPGRDLKHERESPGGGEPALGGGYVRPPMALVLAIDAGTTGVRTIAFDEAGTPIDSAYRELTQHYPRPGWVEHDAGEIWGAVVATLEEVAARCPGPPAAIGITNQRETAVAWDRRTGLPLHRAIVWQDRRTASRCQELEAAGYLPFVREHTGLVLDSYFSATKWEWMVREGGVPLSPGLALGTVDSWVAWNLTGGVDGGVFATEPGNASRTLAFDIRSGGWVPELLELFSLPAAAMAEVRPSSGRIGTSQGPAAGIPLSGMAGDQQAALFGQACFSAGMTKNTYGTGSFVLMNAGTSCPSPTDGLLTTVAWDLGGGTGLTYALEGAVFVTGAAIQWLRDGLGIIAAAEEAGPLAASIPDTEGVYFVPALAGLGSPWWDPDARGTVVGITRGSGRAHLARAAVEAMAFQTRDVVAAMEKAGGAGVTELRVDGGASVMDLLLQIQADQLRIPVARSAVVETTARGAAWLAGRAEGVWGSLDELAETWRADARVEPQAEVDQADRLHAGWLRAVDRSRSWARR